MSYMFIRIDYLKNSSLLILFFLLTSSLFSNDSKIDKSQDLFFTNIKNFYSKWSYRLKKASYSGNANLLERHYNYLSKKYPKDLAIHWTLMTHYQKMGNRIKVKKAVKKYRKALFKKSAWYWRRYNLWYYLARSYGIEGNYKKSIKMHLKSYRHNRYWTNNLLYMYEMYLKLKDYKNAETYLRRYLYRTRIWSNSLRYAESLSNFYLITGKKKKAFNTYRKYCNRNLGDFWGYKKMFSFDFLNEKKIIKLSKRYIKYSRTKISSLFKITGFFIDLKKYKLAYKILNKLKNYYKNRYKIFDYLLVKADLLMKRKSYQKAADTFRKIFDIRKSARAGSVELSFYIKKIANALIRSRNIKAAYVFIKKHMTSDLYNKEKMFLKIEEYFIRDEWKKAYTIAVKYFSTPKLDWKKLNFNDLKRLTILSERYKKKSTCRFLWAKLVEINPHPSFFIEYANFMKSINNLQMAYNLLKKAYTKAAYFKHILFDMVYLASKLKLKKDLPILLRKAYCIYGIDNVRQNIDAAYPELYARIKGFLYKKHSR